MRTHLRRHFPEYTMEAALLGTFMVSACAFATALFHPSSPLMHLLPGEFARRILMGASMGLTAVCLIYSPWGKQSGAHMNPAVTLAFYRLGKVAPADAVAYGISQFAGAALGVAAASQVLGDSLAHRAVNYVITTPGPRGNGIAFLAEAIISFGMMTLVLTMSNVRVLERFTGVGAGCLVALYIAVEAPLSGMSINPARSFGSAVVGWKWTDLWIYLAAPTVGMAMAAELFARWQVLRGAACAKMHHRNTKRCIFCDYAKERSASCLAAQSLETTHAKG